MPQLSENALEVLNKRYLRKDEGGEVIETPIGMIERVAKQISEVEETKELQEYWYQRFREDLLNLYFLPNSPTIRNAGANQGSFSACFVVPIEDSRKSIFQALQHSVEIQAFGGGTGHNFSKLRPEDSLISTTKGKSSGPIGFMKVFDFVIGEVIQQGGCFTGSTLVATAEGPKPIKDLKQDDLVYSWDGRFILAKCTNPWLTKKNAEVWKLSTDKGLIIYATPDHPFLVRYSNGKNKKYVQLKDLAVGTPLMPLTRYKKGNEWFITLHDGKDTRMTEHQWMAEFLDITGHIHHKDGKHDNNISSNLEGMAHSEHNTYHGKKRYQEEDHPFLVLTEEQKIKAVKSRKDWFYGLSEEELLQYRKKVSIGVEGVNQQRIEKGTHNFITNPPMRNEVSKIKKLKNCIANSMWKVMEKGLPVNIHDWEENAKKAGLYNTQRFSVSKIEEIFGSFDSALEYLDNRNQRVLSIEFSHYEDVWNVEVPGPHNFVVCDENRKGVVVSNTRHGAQMGILNIDHQDIEKFITCKQTEGQLSNFNISVAITDHFMKCMNDLGDDFRFAKWPLFFGSKWKEISGYDLWNKIVEGAWKNGEPGIIFIDTINKQSPTFSYQTIESTNPCGEQPLGPYESCNLGSINLSKFVHTHIPGIGCLEPTGVRSKQTIDFTHLREVVRTSVRFLDNVIDANNYPIPEIEVETKKFRKIGLGVMGWADMLIKLGISYNSPEALELAEKVMKFINDEATKYSEELLQEKGHGTWDGFLDPVVYAHDRTNSLFKRRNATLTTIAPTGTLSLIADCSSGIEPVFSFEFKKKCIDKEIVVKHPLYEEWQRDANYQLPYDRPSYFVEANDVPIEQHVRMQAAFQKYVHNGVSKTVNCPNSATIKDIDDAFRLAYELGCKGITVYRDGSREFQAQTAVRGKTKLSTMIDQPSGFDHSTDAIKYLTVPEAKKLAEDISIKAELERSAAPSPDQETPTWLPGWREKVKTGSGTLWVHVFIDPDTGFREVWTAVSKPGRDMAAAADSTGRLITLALKHGASWEEIVKQLQGHIGEKTVWDNGVQIMSIQDGTAKVIRKRCVDNTFPDFTCPFNKKCQRSSMVEQLICNQHVGGSSPLVGPISEKPIIITDNTQYMNYIKSRQNPTTNDLCPDCASILIHDEGCKGGRCANCGYSTCG